MTTKAKYTRLTEFIRYIYGPSEIPLHRPIFPGNEHKYLLQCIESNMVSTAGSFVSKFEAALAEFVGTKFCVATVNGTAAIHTSLLITGVKPGDEVITQALTFVATANAISYAGATPIFVDVDADTLGMSPDSLRVWLEDNATVTATKTLNKHTKARIVACVPMHTFGIPARVAEIAKICKEFKINIVEDAAEALGSYTGTKHVGTTTPLSAISFNGNKIITTGGGGAIFTNDADLALRAKHITTTARQPHKYEIRHDQVAYNYRLPSLNAAVGLAQLEILPQILAVKAKIASMYLDFCKNHDIQFAQAPYGTKPNNWINAIFLEDIRERNSFLEGTNEKRIMTRPIWNLMPDLPMYSTCQRDSLRVSRWVTDRVVNIPSSVPDRDLGHFSS